MGKARRLLCVGGDGRQTAERLLNQATSNSVKGLVGYFAGLSDEELLRVWDVAVVERLFMQEEGERNFQGLSHALALVKRRLCRVTEVRRTGEGKHLVALHRAMPDAGMARQAKKLFPQDSVRRNVRRAIAQGRMPGFKYEYRPWELSDRKSAKKMQESRERRGLSKERRLVLWFVRESKDGTATRSDVQVRGLGSGAGRKEHPRTQGSDNLHHGRAVQNEQQPLVLPIHGRACASQR
jgi:hypothetical protein